ncbi:MAG: NADH:ubiquinone reductase (Na(+)-transporting) subunit A [Saprospiraceae bacterium]|nr:NADH:ubiquinone reductase (Na(+)-transporting) subunit A [Saprospiraceae bacterium]
MLSWGLIITIVLIALFVLILMTVGESLVKLSAKQEGVEDLEKFSVVPSTWESVFKRSKSKPSYIPDTDPYLSFKRGFNISLVGEATASLGEEIPTVRTTTHAIKPKDFVGMIPIPKLLVETGDSVKAGDALFYDKKRPDVIYAAPVSGEVIEIRRAEKRSIAEIVILADQGEMQFRQYELPSLEASRQDLVEFLLESGAWPFLRQRPFDTVADPSTLPTAIFVSSFDTAPLAPDLNLAVAGRGKAFQKGLDVLNKLAENVFLALDANDPINPPAAEYTEAKGVQKLWIKGAHPAGNVGVHMHQVSPVSMQNINWHISVHGVLLLGELFMNGCFDTKRLVAVTGATFQSNKYVFSYQGANISELVNEEVQLTKDIEDYVWVEQKDADGNPLKNKKGKVVKKKELRSVSKPTMRIIAGDALTGKQVKFNGFLGFFDDQITGVEEGDYFEMLGWLVPQKGHPSISRTFPGGFFADAKYEADTNSNGEKRAFVASGDYESVLPMDIYPQHLMRAIQAQNFERMEGLGLLELVEEDIALCEYVCVSKQPLQQILREGLELMREQS